MCFLTEGELEAEMEKASTLGLKQRKRSVMLKGFACMVPPSTPTTANLGGDLPDTSWWQATSGTAYGGLGFRTARSIALSAFVASRITSRPLVRTMVGQYSEATGAPIENIMFAYDKRTEDALIELVSKLPPESGAKLGDELTEAAGEAGLAWQAFQNGEEELIDT